MNILALDASSTHIGYCMSTNDTYRKSGQYTPKEQTANERIRDYMTWLLGLIRVENIGIVVYEKPSGSHGNMNTNLVLGAVRFATWLVCNSSNVAVQMVELSPKTVKATGIYKNQWGKVAKYKIFDTPMKPNGKVNKSETKRMNDEVDAIGLMCAYIKKEYGKELEPE